MCKSCITTSSTTRFAIRAPSLWGALYDTFHHIQRSWKFETSFETLTRRSSKLKPHPNRFGLYLIILPKSDELFKNSPQLQAWINLHTQTVSPAVGRVSTVIWGSTRRSNPSDSATLSRALESNNAWYVPSDSQPFHQFPNDYRFLERWKSRILTGSDLEATTTTTSHSSWKPLIFVVSQVGRDSHSQTRSTASVG